jgi:hypothetical protein
VSRVRSGEGGPQGYVKRLLYVSPFSEPNDKNRIRGGGDDEGAKKESSRIISEIGTCTSFQG